VGNPIRCGRSYDIPIQRIHLMRVRGYHNSGKLSCCCNVVFMDLRCSFVTCRISLRNVVYMQVVLLELGIFHEVIVLGHVVYRSHDLAWFRTLSYYFLLTSNFFLFGEALITHFKSLFMRHEFLQALVTHHRLISYCMYMAGFVWFVLTLKRRHYMRQFTLVRNEYTPKSSKFLPISAASFW
jgi:hypothetical protein